MASAPSGRSENSPAVYCWVYGKSQELPSPGGTIEWGSMGKVQSSLRHYIPDIDFGPSDDSLGYSLMSLRHGHTGMSTCPCATRVRHAFNTYPQCCSMQFSRAFCAAASHSSGSPPPSMHSW